MTNRQVSSTLLISNVLLMLLAATLLMTGFARQRPAVLTAERLNIVDSTGRLALVLANGPRLPGVLIGGHEYPPSFSDRGRSAGMIFYNEVGDEVGGLIFQGTPRDSSYRAFGHMSFDQWRQNQVVAVQYADNGRSRSAGVRVWDRPADQPVEQQFALAEQMANTPRGPARDSLNRARLQARDRVAGTPRLFLGSQDRVARLDLRDTLGRVRVRLSVDSSGAGRLVFLDTLGRATATYP